MQQDLPAGVSRRQMLVRGAALGGAVWAAPTVTAITLTPANAANPSGENEPPPKPKPTPPKDVPTKQPTRPPVDSQPKPAPTAKPPGDEKPRPEPSPSGHRPDMPGEPDRAEADRADAGRAGLPDTGTGNVNGTAALGGALAAGGAVLYAASRAFTDDADDQGSVG